jgi:hypothetical protein
MALLQLSLPHIHPHPHPLTNWVTPFRPLFFYGHRSLKSIPNSSCLKKGQMFGTKSRAEVRNQKIHDVRNIK